MVLRSTMALLALVTSALSQDILFSLSSHQPATPHAYSRDEVHRLQPSGGVAPFLPTEAWRALLGDRDGDGLFDDAPTDIDALHVRTGGGGQPTWLFSTTTSLTSPGSTTIRDGDIFAFDASGMLNVVYAETLFAAATSTTTIDVDAFAEGPAGSLWFSFAEDEVTTDPALVAANGGDATLDEQTVFRIDPGAATAAIALTKAQVVSAFNQAVGAGANTVVDVSGLTLDPTSSGDLLLCAASTNTAFRGKVITTAGGGTLWTTTMGVGVGPSAFTLPSPPDLDALSLTAESPHLVLRAAPLQGSSSLGGPAWCEVGGLAPGTIAHLIVNCPRTASPMAWQSTGIGGFVAIYPDPTDPITWLAFSISPWTLVADANGVARYAWSWQGIAPGTNFLGQVFVPGVTEVSSPAVVNVTM